MQSSSTETLAGKETSVFCCLYANCWQLCTFLGKCCCFVSWWCQLCFSERIHLSSGGYIPLEGFAAESWSNRKNKVRIMAIVSSERKVLTSGVPCMKWRILGFECLGVHICCSQSTSWGDILAGKWGVIPTGSPLGFFCFTPFVKDSYGHVRMSEKRPVTRLATCGWSLTKELSGKPWMTLMESAEAVKFTSLAWRTLWLNICSVF